MSQSPKQLDSSEAQLSKSLQASVSKKYNEHLKSLCDTSAPTSIDVHTCGRRKDSKNNGCFGCLSGCFTCCFMTCYLFCPPIPSFIVRKMAFNPPAEKSYALSYLTQGGERVCVNSASKAYGQNSIRIVPKLGNTHDQVFALLNSEAFIVKTSSRNHLICIWFHPTVGRTGDVVLLFAQPNASDLGEVVTFRVISDRLGADLCCFDYSGYGVSTGRASEANIYKDIQAVFDYVCEANQTAKIVLVGLSIGTAACVDLASKNPDRLSGVVLISPLTSGCRLMRNNPGLLRSSSLDSFCSIDKIGFVDAPVLIIHGLLDDSIPVSHSVALSAKLKNGVPPLYVHEASHNDILGGFSEVYDRISRFIAQEI